MKKKVISSEGLQVLLEAAPERLEIDTQRAAIIIVDMQNAFVSKGGMLDLRAEDVTSSQKVIGIIKQLASAARIKGLKIIYTVEQYSPDLREAGGPDSPMWHKLIAITTLNEHPEWRDKLLIRGTWGAEIIKQLTPRESDIIVEKQLYSAFYQTNLNMILRTYGIKYVFFTGVATNICVEASIRDAFYYGYYAILVSDACGTASPSFAHDATIFNTARCYGWVTTADHIVEVLKS